MILTIVAAMLATTMLVRHLPRALRAVRTPGEGTPGIIAIVNVLLAFAILITAAVQALAGAGFRR